MEESSNDWTSEEKEIYQSKYLAALQTFRELFCERDEFADEQKTHGYLKAAYVEPRVVVLERLTSWCQEQLQEYNNYEGGYSHVVEKDTVQDLAEDLDSYVSSSNSPRTAALWPLVDKVEYGVMYWKPHDS
ncbi:hypothetical protein LTR39_001472 [Cryomyces antarcticus]|nr:hypothetical protein LTR39_001472 [Cryomyces antarcticus]